MRTREQIMAQLEARYAELEAEAASPPVQRPCSACRYSGQPWGHYCAHPLIKGFLAEGQPHVDWQVKSHIKNWGIWPTVALCGHEKVLWEPQPTIKTTSQRIINWIMGAA